MSKNSKYQTHKKSIKLTKNPNDQTGAPRASGALKGGTLSRFLTSIVAEHQKIGGGTLWEIFFEKKSHNAEKTERGGPFSLSRYCMLHGKKGKFFGSVR